MRTLLHPSLWLAASALLSLPAGSFAAPAAAPAPLAPAISPQQQAFFDQKIAPIFSENCYKCHSAAEKVKGGLALDSRDGLLKGGDDGKIFIPGDPAKSMIMQRVTSKDADEKMPPKDANLTPAQIADLSVWVKAGAPIPATFKPAAADDKGPIKVAQRPGAKQHWAWQPVRSPVIPMVKQQGWAKTPVDLFIESKLEKAGLSPSPIADRATLIRRAYFDLVGLPPMPWEVDAFIKDTSPNAWEKVIDRLLASPHYGERWGRYWLDVARYSDTKGESTKKESPQYVDAWSYRDYVIDAFNKDKPYDRFIIEQMAADKLPLGNDKAPLAALGFLTVGDRFNGNANDVIKDRIDVVSKGFLGLTVACARCHDHMFDPIPQKDYYSLHGIFASTSEPKEEPIIGERGDPKVYQDYLKARDDAMAGARKFVQNEITTARALFLKDAGDVLMASRVNGPDRQKYFKGLGLNAREANDLVQFIVRNQAGAARRSGLLGPFVRFAELPSDKYSTKGAALAAEIAANSNPKFPVNPLIAAMFKDKAPLSLEDVAGYYTEFFKNLEPKLADLRKVPAAPVMKPLPFTASAVTPTPKNTTLEELEDAPFTPSAVEELASDDGAQKLLPQKAGVKYQQLLSAVRLVEMTHPGAPKRAMVVQDNAKATNSPVFIRGEAQNRGEIVPHRFLEILSGPQRTEFKDGSGRLELAQAIASKSNPLTARVMMNRLWLHHFGDGIVTTPDDFGTMSAPPSHPEMLDYLALRFMQSGWSVKAMQKLIMMSAVYQQTSETNPTYAKIDPDDRLLWRCNIRRLDFEALRDSLLYIANDLDSKMGGQSVNILSEPYSMRRSVYGYIDRRELPEMMNHFDFANPAMEAGKRHETTVPQQALFMMNSPLMVDTARKLLARKEMIPATTNEDKVLALYWMIFQRAPKQEETELGVAYIKQCAASADPNHQEVAAADVPEEKLTKEQRQARHKMQIAAQAGNKKRYGGIDLANPGEKVERKALTPLENYTQALLMANETVYYN